MSLLILKASVAHTAITNVIINNKVIVYSFCYPLLLFTLQNYDCLRTQTSFLDKKGEKGSIR
jgi:hypothetical protein